METTGPVPEGLMPIVGGIIETARKLKKIDKDLVPMAHVLKGLDSEGRVCQTTQVRVIAFPFKNDEEKRAAVGKLRRETIEWDADAVVIVQEAYMLVIPTKDGEDPMSKIQGSVKETPGRLEAVMFHVETRDGAWIGRGVIENGNLGPVDWLEGGTVDGIFTGIVRKRK